MEWMDKIVCPGVYMMIDTTKHTVVTIQLLTGWLVIWFMQSLLLVPQGWMRDCVTQLFFHYWHILVFLRKVLDWFYDRCKFNCCSVRFVGIYRMFIFSDAWEHKRVVHSGKWKQEIRMMEEVPCIRWIANIYWENELNFVWSLDLCVFQVKELYICICLFTYRLCVNIIKEIELALDFGLQLGVGSQWNLVMY